MSISISDLGFRYPTSSQPVLRDCTVDIPSGSFCLVLGSSGSGKSTFLRVLNGLVPHFSGGTISGTVRVAGHDPVSEGPRVLARHVGFVFQDPESQCVMDRVEDEIAFVLENLAVPADQMAQRIARVLALLDISHLRHRRIETLSGGERQRVAMGAALVQEPSVLVLDEPTSQLDPESAAGVLTALLELHQRTGLTIVLAEHRLERVVEYASQAILISDDGTMKSGSPQDVLALSDSVPPILELGRRMGWNPLPLTVTEARRYVDSCNSVLPDVPTTKPGCCEDRPAPEPVLAVRDLCADYDDQPVLQNASLSLNRGELVALMGRNGTGKTTLLRSIVGLHKRRAGQIELAGDNILDWPIVDICRQIGYLPQRPDDLLFADTVQQELETTLRNHELLDQPPVSCQDLLSALGLIDQAQLYPRDLSVGQRQRVALASIMVTHPRILLLDEPTRGLDAGLKRELVILLKSWCQQGSAVLLSTHDVELVAKAADRVLILDNGHISIEGSPRDVLPLLGDSAPQMVRLLPGRRCVTVDQAIDILT